MKDNKTSKKSIKETGKAQIEQSKIDEAKQKYAKYDQLMDYVPYIIIILFVVIIRTFIATPVRVDGPSMNPTLHDGQVMLLYKLAPKLHGYDRFDIVVVKNEKTKLIKRIIGLPGENIRYEIKEDGDKTISNLYINGKLVSEDKFLSEEKQNQTCSIGGKGNICSEDGITLGKDEYFIMGDNRGNSKDSRVIGAVTKKEFVGKTNIRLFPFNKIGKVK